MGGERRGEEGEKAGEEGRDRRGRVKTMIRKRERESKRACWQPVAMMTWSASIFSFPPPFKSTVTSLAPVKRPKSREEGRRRGVERVRGGYRGEDGRE